MIVSASMLSCDFNNIQKDMEKLNECGIKYLHLDVMDGLFVDNISFGIPVIKSMNRIKNNFIFDTHLMINNPIKYIENFVNVGSDIITFHYEATNNVDEVIKIIKDENVKVGISIKPDTNVEKIFPYLNKIDLVLVMSVYPGFGGQKYLSNSTDRIKILRKKIVENNYNVKIEVDGGINDKNVKEIVEAGADIVVSGSYIFNGNMKDNIDNIYKVIGE